MGCDIHMITQIKKDNDWQYVPEKPIHYDYRNYDVFAFLAQVRGDCENGFYPNGLPEDIGEYRFGQYEYNGEICYEIDLTRSYYHSHSYLTLEEIDNKLRENAPTEEPARIPKRFLKAFYNHGGELPYRMEIIKEDEEAAEFIWDSGLDSYSLLCKGRDELAEIAQQYDVSPDHIRIVFAFDS